uniref:Uncharacterized protein n=1 Tax=Rhizophora mucronata TaxID=61149 RepID=A0A2P2MCX9_RHIMU
MTRRIIPLRCTSPPPITGHLSRSNLIS